MLFSSPDYPLFLIAVFFLYGLARWGRSPLARIAVMVLLTDVIFVLVSKDPQTLWDPIGGILLRLPGELALDLESGTLWDGIWVIGGWAAAALVKWSVGLGVLAGGVAIGRRRGAWLASPAGQRWIARGCVALLCALGVAVAIAWRRDALDPLTAELVGVGHLAILLVLGVGVGASWSGERTLGRVAMLFVASSLFYHAWAAAMHGPYRYLLFLLLSTIVLDYYLGIWIERANQRGAAGHGRLLVILSLVSNLGVLVFFKYADFFVHDVLQLDGVERLNLILPAGISFHTFQSLSYTIDVYRKKLPATRSVVEFATFVLFFPQLVAGPIVRAHDLLPQLQHPPPLELHRATLGLYRIVIGLFKKIALADTLALSIVDRVFEAPERYSSVEVLCGVYGYALQIYLDFSAYSDIAIGSAMILGFALPENFRTPYRSSNLQEFWRRWHISLSTWLRDYLYIALGGSRGTELRTYANLIITMLLGGLWHGASWAFVVWGALHGFGLAVTRYFQRATTVDPAAARRMLAACALIALAGVAGLELGLSGAGTWTRILIAWLVLAPLWAVATAWLGREVEPSPEPVEPAANVGLPFRALFLRGELATLRQPVVTVELLRIGMCLVGLWFLWALHAQEEWTWIPIMLLVWGLGIAADVVERGTHDLDARLFAIGRRALAAILVFHYVCLAWVFFRATSFDNALALLRRLGELSTDHANLVPTVTIALVVGFTCHCFAEGSFRWLRRRFVALPAPLQGVVLAAIALVLRELAHHDIVPFIYFQF
jgi:alginate O-acetyltransferase complex protein AlgI